MKRSSRFSRTPQIAAAVPASQPDVPSLVSAPSVVELSKRKAKIYNRVGRLFLAVGALAAPLCLGGVPVWAAWVCAPFVLGAMWFALRGRESLKVPLLAAVPLFVAAFCALQLLPLPPALLGFVSPPAAELREFALV